MSTEDIIQKAVDLITVEICKCGTVKDNLVITKEDLLYEDDELISFNIMVAPTLFQTDEGFVQPIPVLFQVDYKVKDDEYCFVTGEDSEWQITYGNLFSYMYWSTAYLINEQAKENAS